MARRPRLIPRIIGSLRRALGSLPARMTTRLSKLSSKAQMAGLALVMTLSLSGQATSATPYCEKVDPKVLIQELEGQVNFRDSDLKYRSQVESTDQSNVYRYRYCVTNDHSYTPMSILWRDKNDHSVTVFEGLVAQQAERVQYRDYDLERSTKTFELLFGPQTDEWEGNKDVDTVLQKNSLNRITPIIVRVNELEYADNISEKVSSQKSFDIGKNVQLTSGAIVDIPANTSDMQYLTGLEKAPSDHFKEQTKFVTVELNFVSALQGEELTNFGTFNSLNPELFESAQTIPEIVVKVESSNEGELGTVKIGPEYRFIPKETGGKWFYSYQKVSGPMHQALRRVIVVGPKQEQIGSFLISVLVPSQ